MLYRVTTDLGSDEDKSIRRTENPAHTVNRSYVNHHQVVIMNQNTGARNLSFRVQCHFMLLKKNNKKKKI